MNREPRQAKGWGKILAGLFRTNIGGKGGPVQLHLYTADPLV